MSAVRASGIYTGAVFFHVFLKFKRGMPAGSCMATSLGVLYSTYASNLYSVVILVLTINSK